MAKKPVTAPGPVVEPTVESTRHESGIELMSIEQLCDRFGKTKAFFSDLILNDPLFPMPKADGYSAVEVAAYLKGQQEIEAPDEPYVAPVFEGKLLVQFAQPDPGSFINRANGHVEVKLNTTEELPGLRFYLGGLIQSGAKLPDGRPVSNQREAIRYLFRQMTAEMKQRCPLTPLPS